MLQTNDGSAVDLPSAGAGLGGDGAPGLTDFGASVSGFDADFPFAYYAEQLQALIGANWLKPDAPAGTATGPGAAASTREDPSSLDLWKAMDEGRDPTDRPS